MDFKNYQQKAHSTSLNTKIGDTEFIYPVLGLCGESGEISEKFKKLFRDKNGITTPEFIENLKKELGDCLWYIQEIATKLNLDLNEIAEKNIEKLFSRKDRGVIKGNGDNR